jgi:hypothetical protein
MLAWTIERAMGRWAVVGRDSDGVSRDCRYYPTKVAARAAQAARQEEQAEGVPSDAALRAGFA